MREEALDQRCPAPIFEENGFFTAIFYPNPEVRAQVGTMEEPKTAQVGTKSGPNGNQDEAHRTPESTAHVPHMYPENTPQVAQQVTPQVLTILRVAMRETSAADLQSALRLKDRVHFLKKYLEPALEKGFIERTIPDKPRSSKQQYRTTAAGRAVLESPEKETQS